MRVRLSGETGSGPILDVVKDLESGSAAAEAVMIVESGDLTPRGRLRKAFEPAKTVMSVACYADDATSLGAMAESMLAAEGLELEDTARSAWLGALQGDRAMARGEIEKLILYKGLRDQREGGNTVTLADIEAIAADQGEAGLDTIIGHTMDGAVSEADTAYARAVSSGTSAVAVLRALQRRVDQLGSVQAAGPNDTAIARSGAPRFGPQASQFKRQLNLWTGRRLDTARQLVFDAERSVKRSGAPAEALVGQLVLRLARGAQQMRR